MILGQQVDRVSTLPAAQCSQARYFRECFGQRSSDELWIVWVFGLVHWGWCRGYTQHPAHGNLSFNGRGFPCCAPSCLVSPRLPRLAGPCSEPATTCQACAAKPNITSTRLACHTVSNRDLPRLPNLALTSARLALPCLPRLSVLRPSWTRLACRRLPSPAVVCRTTPNRASPAVTLRNPESRQCLW